MSNCLGQDFLPSLVGLGSRTAWCSPCLPATCPTLALCLPARHGSKAKKKNDKKGDGANAFALEENKKKHKRMLLSSLLLFSITVSA